MEYYYSDIKRKEILSFETWMDHNLTYVWYLKNKQIREFPGSQWLGLPILTANGPGSILGRGTKIDHPPSPSSLYYVKVHVYLLETQVCPAPLF